MTYKELQDEYSRLAATARRAVIAHGRDDAKTVAAVNAAIKIHKELVRAEAAVERRSSPFGNYKHNLFG